jgi:hypothetical protein
MIILLESTALTECIQVQQLSDDTCCTALLDHKDEPEKENEDCTSGCNPFQNCSCCKDANHTKFSISKDPFINSSKADLRRTYEDMLQDSFISHLTQPPELI